MPGDTSIFIYTDTVQGVSYYLRPSGDTVMVEGVPVHIDAEVRYNPGKPESSGASESIMFFAVSFLIVVFLTKLFGRKEEVPYSEMTPAARRKKAAERVNHNRDLYDQWLSNYNPYYAGLNSEMRARFLQRTVEFAESKEFRFHELEEDEAITILISGAAVQLTFGLANFLMDYFHVIHVIRKEYVLHHDNETYFGHVSRNGIYISWDHFARGYLDYTDGVNVGLHEMAHAVSYDVFLGYQDRHDRGFKKRLQEFRIEGSPVFRAMKESNHDLLDSYAATNFDEFWAVCIETFFETPESFREEEPGLYATICELLNQDPTRPDKIIDLKLAGIRP